MININHFKKLSGAVLFLMMGTGFSYAQSTPKFDRSFRALYENAVQGKTAAVLTGTDAGPQKLDEKTTKSGQVLFSCIIYTTKPAALKAKGIQVQSVLPKFVTALISAEDLIILKDMPEVTFVKAPKEIPPANDISIANSGAALLQAGALNNTSYTGKGVLVGILDTGIDWKHPDFRNPTDQTKSRIVRMWDQMITPTGTEASPSGFSYGVEYTQDQISAELAGSTSGAIREKDQQGHGTHVAGTAAGNGYAVHSGTTYTLSGAKYKGMAPEADLVIVRGASTGGFSSSNIINGLTYFQNVSAALNKPIVVNMSIGGHYSAHDGTDDEEVAVDNFTASGPGRVVAIAAGNEGGTNMHKQDVVAPGASATASIVIPSNTTATPVLGYIVFANAADSLNAVFTDPTGATVNIPIDSDNGSGVLFNNNSFRLYVANYINPPDNKRYVDIYVARVTGNTTDAGGTYTLRIDNTGSTSSTLNGWLYSNKVPGTLTNGDSQYIVGTPGNANSAITVAAYTSKMAWFSKNSAGSAGYAYPYRQDDIAPFSSTGPRADGVLKPEITAAGNLVVSSLASGTLATSDTGNIDGTYYRTMSGTSMATPGVAGSVALMLQLKPGTTASQIKNYLTANAQSDAITGTVPNPTWGYGKLDVFQAASDMNGTKLKRHTFINETPDPYVASTDDGNAPLSTQRIAESFTPDITGKLGGVYFHTLSDAGAGGSYSLTGFTIEIHESNNGVPGALLASKSVDPTYVSKLSWNYINLSDLNINVTSGKDFFVELYAGTGSTWGVRRFSTNPNNRSQISTDNGTTWSAASVGYRIRSVAYESPQTSLATSETAAKAEVQVYPNPAADVLNVRMPKAEKYTLKVYDMAGRMVKQMEADSGNIQLNVAPLPKGEYLLSISSETQKVTKKFIKK